MGEKLFQFAAETQTDFTLHQSWKILVVDDDDEVHNITKAVLKDCSFEGKRFEVIYTPLVLKRQRKN
jgi:FixJ family two-component response regulator